MFFNLVSYALKDTIPLVFAEVLYSTSVIAFLCQFKYYIEKWKHAN